MMKNSIEKIKERFKLLSWALDERTKRLLAAAEAKTLGRGGITHVAQATGLSRMTIYAGLKELKEQSEEKKDIPRKNIRKPGGGRKKVLDTSPQILEDLKNLVESTTRGDPESPLLWTGKSLRNLSEELVSLGYKMSHETTGLLLKKLGYSLQSNRKALEGSDHPDRHAQFEFINTKVLETQSANNPVISVDTKKKE